MPKSAGISPTFLPKPMAQNPLSHRCICFHPDFWYASASSSRHYGIYYSKCIPYMLHCAGPDSPWKRPTKHDLPHPTVQDDITLRLFSVGRLHHSNTSGKSTLQFQPVPVQAHRFHSPCGIPRCFRCHTECAFPDWFSAPPSHVLRFCGFHPVPWKTWATVGVRHHRQPCWYRHW